MTAKRKLICIKFNEGILNCFQAVLLSFTSEMIFGTKIKHFFVWFDENNISEHMKVFYHLKLF